VPCWRGMVRSAFVHGLDLLLWACGGIGLAGIALALIFLPAGSLRRTNISPSGRRRPGWCRRNPRPVGNLTRKPAGRTRRRVGALAVAVRA
jgi:hypothetical protein